MHSSFSPVTHETPGTCTKSKTLKAQSMKDSCIRKLGREGLETKTHLAFFSQLSAHWFNELMDVQSMYGVRHKSLNEGRT